VERVSDWALSSPRIPIRRASRATGTMKYPTRIGRLFIMIGLGAYFGNTVLFRLSMLAGRAQFFLQVLKIIPM